MKISRREMFVFDVHRCGFLYAMVWLLNLPYLFDTSTHRTLKALSDRAFDWCSQKVAKKTPKMHPLLQPAEYTSVYPVSKHLPESQTTPVIPEYIGIDLKKLQASL